MRQPPSAVRPGMSLLEVLVALAIMLLSLAALYHLVILSGDQAFEAHHRSQAFRLCQSKLAEIRAGIVPLSSQDEQSFDDADEESQQYVWKADVTPDDSGAQGLYRVTVTVRRDLPNGNSVEATLGAVVLDPSVIGSTQDTAAITSTAGSGSGSSGSTTGTSGTGSGSGGTPSGSGSTAKPASSGAAAGKGS